MPHNEVYKPNKCIILHELSTPECRCRRRLCTAKVIDVATLGKIRTLPMLAQTSVTAMIICGSATNMSVTAISFVLLCCRRQAPQAFSLCCSAVGPRTAKGIADALTAALPSTHISKLKDAPSYSNFTTTSSLPTVVLFTDKPKTSALYKSLSLRFKGRLTFAEVNSKASDIIEQQAVEKFPKLVVLDGDHMQEYSGSCCCQLCHARLKAVLAGFLLFIHIRVICRRYQMRLVSVHWSSSY